MRVRHAALVAVAGAAATTFVAIRSRRRCSQPAVVPASTIVDLNRAQRRALRLVVLSRLAMPAYWDRDASYLTQPIAGFFGFLGGIFGPVASWAIDGLSVAWNYLQQFVDRAISMAQGAIDFANELENWIRDQGLQLWYDAQGFASEALTKAKDWADAEFALAYETAMMALNKAQELSNDLINGGAGLVDRIADLVWDRIKGLIETLIDHVLDPLWDTIYGLIDAAIRSALETLDFGLDWIKYVVETGLQLVFDEFTNVIDLIRLLLRFARWVFDSFGDLIDGDFDQIIRHLYPTVEHLVRNTVNDNAGSVSSFLEDVIGHGTPSDNPVGGLFG